MARHLAFSSLARPLLLGLTILLPASATAYAAASVTLECAPADPKAMRQEGWHSIYEIDYDARTVREHYLDDDGAPIRNSADTQSTANVSDQEITWTENMAPGPIYYTLGRFSGTLTAEKHFDGGIYTIRQQCHPYSLQNRQRQF